MKKYVFFILAGLLSAHFAFAENFLDQNVFKSWLENRKQIVIVDIQPLQGYAEHHFRNSFATNAFPVDTPDEKKRLDVVLPDIMGSQADVVIIRPPAKPGRIAAIRAYEYLILKGVPEGRLYILEGGIETWPYEGMIEKGIHPRK